MTREPWERPPHWPSPEDRRAHWRDWRTDPRSAPWRHARWHARGQPFLRRIVRVLVILLVLISAWTGLVTFVTTRWLGGGGHPAFLAWIGSAVLTVALPILGLALAARVFRSYALPLADIMDAAEAVASGDLETRVQARGSREFQRLAQSFNHMIEELSRIDRQRRNLTADVAHELRTPLHIIRGNLEGILDGVYAPTPEHIEATLQETRALARLVDDLRTLSLAESGQLPLVLEPVDAGDLLADVVTSFGAQAESAGVALSYTVAATPLELLGDAGRLDQVLSNLVNNALRHTPSGGRITLTAAPMDGQVRITVADDGEGIAPDDLPFVFDRFWRGDRVRTHSGSTGLGLAIAGQLIKAHDGAISVASLPGDGTTFTLDLPLAPSHEES